MRAPVLSYKAEHVLRRLIIENFKSIDRLELDLGRVNLIIGENGCGKTNILEALGMASAAAANTLDPASLKARGIRVTDPTWMRSGFQHSAGTKPIQILASSTPMPVPDLGEDPVWFILYHDNSPFGQWTNRAPQTLGYHLPGKSESLRDFATKLAETFGSSNFGPNSQVAETHALPNLAPSDFDTTSLKLKQWYLAARILSNAASVALPTFLTYTPHEDSLRDLARDSDIEPIGIHGEGLFKLLQVLDQESQLQEIKEQLALLGWFDDLSVASGTNPSTRALQIHDVYIDGRTPFDQRSANEGFLFVLLYACLLVSKYTPRFFAVDNVDAALNPKLCAGIVRMFAGLTAKHDKQVILTTHNPGALDGIDLHDDEQRLFVVYRNTEGKTRARRITPADLPSEGPPVRLSEAFLRGYIGALPTNF